MKFENNKVYRNSNGKDLDLHILRVQYQDEKKAKVIASLIYRSNGQTCVTEKYTITNKEDWNEVVGTGQNPKV